MHLKSSLAALGIASIVATGLGAVPSVAASGNLVFICGTVIGDKEFITTADTDLPATLATGASAPVNVTAKVTIPDDVRNAVYTFFGARKVAGTAKIQATQNGAALPDIAATVASADLPASGPVTVTATGAGPTFTPTAAGTYVLKAASYTASLVFTKEDGSAAYTADVSCTPKPTTPAQDLTVDTVTVADATTPTTPGTPAVQATTTTVSGKYAKKQSRIVAKVKVGSADNAATGKAKVKVTRGKKKVANVRVEVKAGKAKVVVAKVTKPGAYTITVSYAGDATHAASKGRTKVKVG
ncbi:hypothetical protein ASC64_10160 [Nocardioides sp. Root122]|uniref:DUF6801 domain-containing protein n=1 Tax=Nocardioides TaxID=1839 RepID=UPI000702622F|nr:MULTISPECIES: DUF6801 domain-containing protein [Nocardioides]KQV67595.1 hypothetical protein ASC64_10160 [Nocardioides sp. Root122]MCK9824196.1 hypothetical protein [Nocardioides cavernae]